MTAPADNAKELRQARHRAIRAEVAQEEAAAVEAEVAEKVGALEVALHLRIDRDLDVELRRQAAAAHVPTSALIRRMLRQAVLPRRDGLTATEVEAIARRVAREEFQGR
ncbi:MAG: ribbon-helix-helix protein, CopG family [Sporichthyaceae bacterium]